MLKNYTKIEIMMFFIYLFSIYSLVNTFCHYRDLAGFLIYVSKGLFFILGILVYDNFICKKKGFANANIISLVLLIFIFLASVGTDTPILYHAMFHPAPLYLAIILQFMVFDNDLIREKSLILTLIVIAGLIIVKGFIYNSMQYNNLLTQNKAYKVSGTNIYLDRDTVSDLNTIKATLNKCGYTDGDYISVFYSMVQIVFAVNGRSPITAWYSYGDKYVAESAYAGNQYLMSKMSKVMLKNLFIIINKDQLYDGLGFPLDKDYEFCGEAKLSGTNLMIGGTDYLIYHHK